MRCKPSVPLGRVIWIIGSCCWSTETQAIAQLFDILLQVVFGATVCFFFFFFTHPEEYMMAMINVFIPDTL